MENIVNKKEKMKLLKVLPKPNKLKGLMPKMNHLKILDKLSEGNIDKIGDITLIAILIATARLVMNDNEDWGEYLDPDNESDSTIVPEPCGDPECESCTELAKLIAEAKEEGAEVRAMRLTKEQAIKMGLIDKDGNDLTGKEILSNHQHHKVIH